jgi:ferredoxin
MADADIRFEREGLVGIVAVGSSLSDVFKRFGVKLENKCDLAKGTHGCEVTITEGADLLSELTDTETEHFGSAGRRTNRRLACEAKIIKPGGIVIMTDQKREPPKQEAPKKDKFQEEFKALPLEEKLASLFRMEVVALGETFNFVVNSITEFGSKLETEVRKATRSGADACASEPKGAKAKQKSPPKAAPPPQPHSG